MSGVTSVKATDNTLTLADFKKLTVNRDVNKGTLIVSRGKGNKVTGLKCVGHHVYRSNKTSSINSATRADLNAEFKKVVDHELETLGSKLMNSSAGQEDDLAKISAQITRIKDVFNSEIKNAEDNAEFKSLPREAIGRFVVSLENLSGVTLEKLETLSDAELKAFVSGSWAVGDFRLAQVSRVPNGESVDKAIRLKITAFVETVVPKFAERPRLIAVRSEGIGKYAGTLKKESFEYFEGYDGCKDEIDNFVIELKALFKGYLSSVTEEKLRKMFKQAFTHLEEAQEGYADDVFIKMRELIGREDSAVDKERSKLTSWFCSVLEKHGLDCEIGNHDHIPLSYEVNDGIHFRENSVWNLLLAVERQDKNDQKLLKDLNINRNSLDTFIAFRKLSKDLQGLLQVK